MRNVLNNPTITLLILGFLVLPLLAACGEDGTSSPARETSPPTTSEPTVSPTLPVADLVTYTEDREPCACRNKNKNVYWGELHAHTILSYDAYAWGTMTGRRNTPTWESMQIGDFVLCVYDATYHYVSKVLGKFNNEKFAVAVWGTDTDGNTWPYMYFLEKPIEINMIFQDGKKKSILFSIF